MALLDVTALLPPVQPFAHTERDGDNYLYHIPLRITEAEWVNLMDTDFGGGKVIEHPRFALQQDVVWCDDWDYCEVITVALPYRKAREFGPHWTNGLARRKALAYLIEHKAIEILPPKQAAP